MCGYEGETNCIIHNQTTFTLQLIQLCFFAQCCRRQTFTCTLGAAFVRMHDVIYGDRTGESRNDLDLAFQWQQLVCSIDWLIMNMISCTSDLQRKTRSTAWQISDHECSTWAERKRLNWFILWFQCTDEENHLRSQSFYNQPIWWITKNRRKTSRIVKGTARATFRRFIWVQ